MLQTETNTKNTKNSLINQPLLNSEFVTLINTLSKAILEFYNVSKNISLNKDVLINYGKKELKSENNSNINTNNGNNDRKENNIKLIKNLTDIFNELEFNNKSQRNNLLNFFEDSKILFKKLKEKRHELILKEKSYSLKKLSASTRNSHKNIKGMLEQNQNKEGFDEKFDNENFEDNAFRKYDSNSTKNKEINLNNRRKLNSIEIENLKFKTSASLKNENYLNDADNNLNLYTEKETKTEYGKVIRISSNEIIRLRNMNKKLNEELRKYKTSYKYEGINNQNNNNFNNFEKINIYIKDKDKLISTLKNEMNQSNQNFKALINKYKTEMFKLKQENKQLKFNVSYSVSNKSELDKNVYSRLGNLMKENRILKDNLEELKMANLHSEYNTKIYKNLSLPPANESRENQYLKNKIKILEKKFEEKLNENDKLNNTIMFLQKKFDEEKSNLTRKIGNLSMNLLNKQNEKLDLQNEKMNKNNALENLKYKRSKDMKEKQIMKTEENGEQFNEYENISKYNNRIIELESNLEKIKKLNLDQNNQISILNQQIYEKEAALLEQGNQMDQLNSNLTSQKIENQQLLKVIESLRNNQPNNELLNNLKEKLQEQQNLNKDLNEKLFKINHDNKLLKNEVAAKEKQISQLNEIYNEQELKEKEIENLKKEMESLKFENEKLNFRKKEIRELLPSNIESTLKKKNEEIEGLNQLIKKMQEEREKGDNELTALKRENEKIKKQIVRLSETIPEEYNDLEKKYKDLENKYFSLKNKNTNSQTPRKNKSEEKLEDKFTKELTEAKKQIEQLKKKNVELVTQLEDKEINKNFFDNRSEDANKSNYEEEFDLRKMAKGAKEKNRSQDINIDYPGIQTYKEKVRELEFYYNSLENLVKKLLLTIQCNPKNKTYVAELCRIVGFDLETTNKILTNKNKNFILGLFSKQ
jgi:hypothetical protein